MGEPQVVTVTGAIPASQLGPTLAHEHLYSDFSVFSGRPDNRFTAASEVINELAWFSQAGGRSIVEVTPEGTGRDPVQLREISRASGVQVISGIAFYEESTYPAWVRAASVEQIAEFFVFHLEEGHNGVRAGVIGEITSHNEDAPNPSGYRLQELERRVFEAAAVAQRQTGACITTHAALGRAGHAQLNVLERAGADLTRVIIGHCDAHWHDDPELDYAYYLPILERGACCEFDLIGWTELASDDVRADRLAALIAMGYAPQLLLATDTCRLSHLRGRGGRGYDFLWTAFLPRLTSRGVSDTHLNCMLVETPQRMFARCKGLHSAKQPVGSGSHLA
jgi:phosphotriesterase-related protein